MRFILLASSPCIAAGAMLLVHTRVDAQAERRVLSGDRIAIYNLAGKLRVESGGGSDVVVEVMRGGRDGDRLRLEQGTIRGYETLRVMYPSDASVYPELGRNNRNTVSVRESSLPQVPSARAGNEGSGASANRATTPTASATK